MIVVELFWATAGFFVFSSECTGFYFSRKGRNEN
jgi:hypothetical protein